MEFIGTEEFKRLNQKQKRIFFDLLNIGKKMSLFATEEDPKDLIAVCSASIFSNESNGHFECFTLFKYVRKDGKNYVGIETDYFCESFECFSKYKTNEPEISKFSRVHNCNK